MKKYLVLICVLAFSAPAFASKVFVKFEGVRQGAFKGETNQRGREGWSVGSRFNYEVKSPRDAASGMPTGKRQHKPITITKEWGAASPQLLTALVTNEVLKSVVFEVMRGDPRTGQEILFQTIRLTNASVVEVRQMSTETTAGGDVEEVSFTFQKIEIENKDGKTSYADDWMAQ